MEGLQAHIRALPEAVGVREEEESKAERLLLAEANTKLHHALEVCRQETLRLGFS